MQTNPPKVDRLSEKQKRAIWLRASRDTFRPGKRQRCAVCEKYEFIAQAHHLTPLAMQYESGAKVPDHAYIWLCPNHHAAVHLLISQGRYEREIPRAEMIDLAADTEAEEFKAIFAIFEMCNWGKA